MKVQCPKCSAVYRLPDERIPAGSGKLKVRCKHCGFVIEVKAAPPEEGKSDTIKWYVAVGNERQGPFAAEDVVSRIHEGSIGAESYAWRKGFKDWLRLGDIDEFKAEMAPSSEDVEETQLMDLKDFKRMTGEQEAVDREDTPAPESSPDIFKEASDRAEADAGEQADQSQSGEQSQSGMVWQRRETSVLFSLDDYKTRKQTRGGSALTGSSQLEMKPIEDTGRERPGGGAAKAARKDTVISLEESQVRLIAEKMSKKARRKKIAIGAVLGVVGTACIVAAAVWFVTRPPAPPAPEPAKPVAVAKPEPVAPAPVETATAAKAEQPAPAAADAVKPEPSAVAARKAPAPAARKAVKKKTTSKSTKKKSAKKKKAKKTKPKPAEPAPAPKAPTPKATDDVNALLASYRSGKKSGSSGSGASKANTANGAAATSDLPSQLTMGQIQSVLRRQTRNVRKCVQKAGVAKGTTVKAKTRIVIGGSGRVVSVSVSNAAGAEACIRSKLNTMKFPRFKGANMVVPYPFTVTP